MGSAKKAGEQRTFCKYCNSEHTTDLDYGLHRLSNPHVKKIKMELLQCDFSSVCRVCTLGLRDLQDVENHVQGHTHTDNLDSRLSISYATSKSSCGLCGVSFYNETALETHRLMPSHRNAANSYSFPKLDELLRQLSGMPGEHLALDISSLCSICDVQYDGLDAYIMHLFTSGHVSQLRFSSCLVCKKEFIHADNRESHLGSSKHLSNVKKYSNLLEEGPRFSLLMKGGYPCMFCMVLCSSWLCLELHLQYSSHANAARLSKAKHPVSTKIMFAIPRDVEDDQDNVCDVNAARRWREWRHNVSKEHAWCHKCGASLSTLNVANAHSEMHDSREDQLVMHKRHAHEASDSSSAPVLFDCCVCALSFKSSLLLAAHEASFQHHIILAKFPFNEDLTCCAICGVLVSKEEVDEVNTCKEEFNVSHMHINETGHETKEGLCVFDPCRVKEERSPMECNNHGAIDPLVFTGGNRGTVKKDAGMAIIQRETGNKEEKNGSHVKVIPKAESGSGTRPLACASGHVENDVQQDTKIPIIAAAALAPLGAVHQSLHSIMTIVVKALSATLPHSAFSLQENLKRERQRDQEVIEGQPAAKKLCTEEAMKETLHHILHSVRSNSASPAMDDKSMDKNETVLVVAASLVPKFSPDSCGSVGVQGEAIMTQQGFATEGPNEPVDKSIDIKRCVEQGMEGNQCASEKSHADDVLRPVIQNNEREMQVLPHGKESTCLMKVKELPALTLDVGMSSICVKMEKDDERDGGMSPICVKIVKDDEHDGDGSFSVFKDTDLWWVLSDSEDCH